MEKLKVNGFMKWSNIKEDIAVGYAPNEISFMGYTTKNLHHSADATKAFVQTIDKVKKGELKDGVAVLHALQMTDQYMKLNDMHLEQGKPLDSEELTRWKRAHNEARNHLHRIGEFMHHMDYWHTHEHELQDIETNYTPETAGAEMADSYTPQGELVEELTDKTIRQSDKVKVARVIADMLGVEKAESMSPDAAVNAGLRAIKNKRMTPELSSVLRKMLTLATDVGIKVDHNMIPKTIKEAADEPSPEVNPKTNYNMAGDILRLKDYIRLMNPTSKVGHSIQPDKPGPEDEQLRRRKVAYKTEQVEMGEDLATADYKVNPETGRKHRAGRINFANSGMKDKLEPEDDTKQEETVTEAKATYCGRCGTTHVPPSQGGTCPALKEEKDEHDIDDDELDKMANEVDHEDDILHVYDDDELAIIDPETGEEVEEDEDDINEEALNEVLSRSERMRSRIRFMRTKSKRSRRLQLVLKRRSDSKTINKRSRRLAIKMIKERIVKKPLSQMTVSEKERVERMLEKRKALIDRLAMRLAPRVRRIESDRLTHKKTTKPASTTGA